MEEENTDNIQLMEGVLDNVRPPILDFILLKETNDYKDYRIITKKNSSKIMFSDRRNFKFLSVSPIKLLSKNVKKVIKPTERVNINTTIINIFLFKKLNII